MIRIGILTPHAAIGPEEEFPAMAPRHTVTHVARVPAGPLTATTARSLAAPPVLDKAAELLTVDPIDVIGIASTSLGYTIGHEDESALVSRLAHHVGIPVLATCPAAVQALRALDVRRIALVGPPWFDEELNRLGAKYFQGQGLHVESSASADLPQDPAQIEAAEVCEWTSRHVPDTAEGIFIGGNGFRAAGAIEALEAALGRPVLTSNQVLLWKLLASTNAAFDITGFGRLFSHMPG